MEKTSEESHVAGGSSESSSTGKTKKVLVAVDESEGSLYALSWALDNIIDNVDQVVLLHVQQPFQHFDYPAGPAGVYATAGVVDSVKKAQQHNSEVLLSRNAQVCRNKRNVEVQSVVMDGDPKDMICHAIEQMHIDLAIVGSRGLGKIKRAFLGSVSDYCAHHAKCPILIVKPPKNQNH